MATIISNDSNGDWPDGDAWVGGIAPVPSDDVIIMPGHIISLALSAANVSRTGATLVDVGGRLTVTGAYVLACSAGAFTVNGAVVAANITFSGTSSLFEGTTGTIQVTGNFNTNACKSITLNGTMNILNGCRWLTTFWIDSLLTLSRRDGHIFGAGNPRIILDVPNINDPSVNDVRYNTAFGVGLAKTGLCRVPPKYDVRQEVLVDVSDGGEMIPVLAGNVRLGVWFDHSQGTRKDCPVNRAAVGTYYGSPQDGYPNGYLFNGTFVNCPADKAEDGTLYGDPSDQTEGTLVVPVVPDPLSSDDVRDGVAIPGTETTGNIRLTTADKILTGTGIGSNGTEIAGTAIAEVHPSIEDPMFPLAEEMIMGAQTGWPGNLVEGTYVPTNDPDIDYPKITTVSPIEIEVGNAISLQLDADNIDENFEWKIINGRWPKGINLSPDGYIYGESSEPGIFSVVVQVKNMQNDSGDAKTFVLLSTGTDSGLTVLYRAIYNRISELQVAGGVHWGLAIGHEKFPYIVLRPQNVLQEDLDTSDSKVENPSFYISCFTTGFLEATTLVDRITNMMVRREEELLVEKGNLMLIVKEASSITLDPDRTEKGEEVWMGLINFRFMYQY